MKSLWSDNDTAQYRGDLRLRVYTSRLLGRNPSLVQRAAVEYPRLDRIPPQG